MAGKQRKTNAEWIADAERAKTIRSVERWRRVQPVLIMLALAIVVLATQPTAHTLSGKNTHVNVTLSITLTVVLTFSTGVAAAWGNHHRRRANTLDDRNKRLVKMLKKRGVSEADIKEAQE